MSLLQRLPLVSEARRALAERARAAWARDRTDLRGPGAVLNRLFRMAVLVGRGVIVHRLGMLAASLTFFTVFSVVPMLVVVLWALKLLDHLPTPAARLPTEAKLSEGDQMLQVALSEILRAVHRAGEVTGLVGLVALLYVAAKMFSFTERAFYTIAGAGKQTPKLSRALGYLALFLMPPAVLGLGGLLQAAGEAPFGKPIRRALAWIPRLDLLIAVALGFGVLWLAATLLYWAAVRARIPFRSAVFGGLFSALALPIVFWAHANFQIGMSKASPLGSGFLAFPVFLTWSFSSWYALLMGAEIAVAHHGDVVLARGARAFALDLAGEREASLAVLVRLAPSTTQALGPAPEIARDDLARTLGLPPQVVGQICARLVTRGLLVEVGQGFSLGFDAGQTTVTSLLEAVEHDPALARGEREISKTIPPRARPIVSKPFSATLGGLTLAELANGQTGRA